MHTHGPVRRINAHGTRHGAKHGQLYWGTVPDSERYGCEGAGTNQTCPTRSRGSCGAGHQGLVPGTKNPADLFTKNLANIGEFHEKNGIICGSKPFLYESKNVRAILEGGHTPMLKSKKKIKKQQN